MDAISAGQLNKLYDAVSANVAKTIASGEFTTSQLRPVVLAVVDIVQKYSDGRVRRLTGVEKQQLALDLAQHVLDDLYHKGVMSKEVHEQAQAALAFAGPALIDGMKALWKQIELTIDDIRTRGCKGCIQRRK